LAGTPKEQKTSLGKAGRREKPRKSIPNMKLQTILYNFLFVIVSMSAGLASLVLFSWQANWLGWLLTIAFGIAFFYGNKKSSHTLKDFLYGFVFINAMVLLIIAAVRISPEVLERLSFWKIQPQDVLSQGVFPILLFFLLFNAWFIIMFIYEEIRNLGSGDNQ
jgi:uncharacterized membrane protein